MPIVYVVVYLSVVYIAVCEVLSMYCTPNWNYLEITLGFVVLRWSSIMIDHVRTHEIAS